ncbi:MAG TPA: S1/P1 Nuclease [Phenylobacterium sp.]|nr:S1/P1 Nuclease [Phenylobacterium sp.]
MKRLLPLAVAALAAVMPSGVLAWGGTGHRMIGEVAMRNLPAGLPAFLHNPQAVLDVGELSREPDRDKRAGRVHDSDREPAHFLDLNDDGTVLGGPKLSALPPTRADYEKALQVVGQNSWKAGYLPYAIVDRYQQLALDFAYWRTLTAAEANPAWKEHRDWFAADRRRREAQILETIGQLSHFVGDGSQPLHVSIHFNGWGDFPNPGGYSAAKLHAPFESDLVRSSVSEAAVAARLTPPRQFDGTIEQRTADYLAATARLVVPFYEMEKAGGMAPGDPRGPKLATQQLAVAASELRDLIGLAWNASANMEVGWKPVAVADVVAGRVDPYPALTGVD